MKKLVTYTLIISLFGFSCTRKTDIESFSANKSSQKRGLASIKSKPNQTLPQEALLFILGKEQRVKPRQAIKHFANVIPPKEFERLLELSLKVDDIGFSIKRSKDTMLMSTGEHDLKVNVEGPINHMIMEMQGLKYDFAKPETLNNLITYLETKVASDMGASHKTVSPFFKICSFLPLSIWSAQSSYAMNWFFVGGMAIVAVAIIYAASKLSKAKVKAEGSIDEKTQKTLDNLSKAIQNGKVDVNANIDGNIDGDIDTNTDININTGDLKDLEDKAKEQIPALLKSEGSEGVQ